MNRMARIELGGKIKGTGANASNALTRIRDKNGDRGDDLPYSAKMQTPRLKRRQAERDERLNAPPTFF
jgi:hypothetical protein